MVGMYLKERWTIYLVFISAGLISFLYIYNQDTYDLWVFVLSLSALVLFMISGYIILFGPDIRDLISQDNLSGISRNETIKKILIGFHPTSRMVAIIALSTILLLSYWNIVPDYENSDVELHVGEIYYYDSNLIKFNVTLLNNGSRPVYVLYPKLGNTLFIDITDSSGNSIISDFIGRSHLYYEPSRKKLESGDNIKLNFDYQYTNDERYQYKVNYSIEYGTSLEVSLYGEYWTYGTISPYTISVQYDSSSPNWYKPVWRGTLEYNMHDIELPPI